MNPLESAQSELVILLKKREEVNRELDRKIEAVQQSIRILLPVYGQPERDHSFEGALNQIFNPEEVGITEAIEWILITHPDEDHAPTAVRDLLLKANFKVTGDNPMASIHQILRRLVNRGGPIQAVDTGDGTLYRYNSSIPPKPGPLSRRYGTLEKMREMQMTDPAQRRPGADLASYTRYRSASKGDAGSAGTAQYQEPKKK
jgi:hypothetical protein